MERMQAKAALEKEELEQKMERKMEKNEREQQIKRMEADSNHQYNHTGIRPIHSPRTESIVFVHTSR
jgi:hypothetical protein